VVPLLVVLVWLVAGGPLGSFAGRLSQVQTNDASQFLPVSAESTQVQQLQERFAQQETVPAVVVWELTRPVTPDDVAIVSAELAEAAQIEGVVGEVAGPIPSEDGLALTAVVGIDAADAVRAADVVEEFRAIVAEGVAGGGVDGSVYVTGPAGLIADFGEAFGEIDGILLLTTLGVVLVILLLVYRSPVLPFVVLLSGVLALGTASATVYALADAGVVTLNGQSQGILFILVLGASTDYALLLVARFREELRDRASRYDAMVAAWRGTAAAIVASGATVIAGVLCLLVSDLSSNRGLGPVAAVGIAFALLASLTFLPAALVLLGRAAFWPFRPALGSPHSEVRGIWGKVARLVGRRYRPIWVITAAVLAGCAAFAPTFEADGLPQTDFFLTEVEAVTGQEALARHFPAGSGSPVVVIAPEDELADVTDALAADPGVAAVSVTTAEPGNPEAPPLVVDGLVEVQGTLTDVADGPEATATVERLREALAGTSPDALVGGQTAQQLDVTTTAQRDLRVIVPLVLVVVLLVLVVLLRALVAPLLLVVTVVLSFAATLGVAAVVFDRGFGWPGADPAVPLFAFVFLVALGVDYNIFLMTRVREESLERGTRPGILHGLAVTGGVITSAGVVLAATFSALAVLPLLFLAQVAFLVAFGVLLDTIVVRSLLVPALAYDLDHRIWWPDWFPGSVAQSSSRVGNGVSTTPPSPVSSTR
jgi:RND superfamily putative drug exporter